MILSFCILCICMPYFLLLHLGIPTWSWCILRNMKILSFNRLICQVSISHIWNKVVSCFCVKHTLFTMRLEWKQCLQVVSWICIFPSNFSEMCNVLVSLVFIVICKGFTCSLVHADIELLMAPYIILSLPFSWVVAGQLPLQWAVLILAWRPDKRFEFSWTIVFGVPGIMRCAAELWFQCTLTQEHRECQGTHLHSKSSMQQAPGTTIIPGLQYQKTDCYCNICNHLFHLIGKLTLTPIERTFKKFLLIYFKFVSHINALISSWPCQKKKSCVQGKKKHHPLEWLLQYQVQEPMTM